MYTSVGLVIAGVIHSFLGLAAPIETIDQLWFIGAGLALGMLGLLNLVRVSVRLTNVTAICAVANLISSLYLLNVVRMLPAPHVLGVLALALVATYCTLAPQTHVRSKA